MKKTNYLSGFVGALTFVIGALLSAPALAEYPQDTVRIVVPYPPGGANDVMARILGEKLSQRWSVPVVIDNRSGAAGMIATEYVGEAKPDGYTLLLPNTAVIQAPHLYKEALADPINTLTPIAGTGSASLVMVVKASTPVSTPKEFAEYVRDHPDKAVYGTYGAGSSGHMYGHVFAEQLGLDMIHVAFRGEAPSVNELLAGQIPMVIMSGKGALALIEDGRLRALGVTGPDRMAALPDVPTFKEQGFERMDYSGWFGIFGPAGMPEPLVSTISEAVVDAANDPTVVERMGKLTLRMKGVPYTEFQPLVARDNDLWAGIIKSSGVSLD
ncbi:Bug family tripartite tricarboxylate transporter substrate binding protein [Alloalcanivorax mobilis]|uniref:Bug family tripartite tricarboxylate transporter substrate binding protein n=1 Tax=Alloalcanivorax mobilis TaxID=2019569 RepID=UPI000B5B41FD|nr:tripartite tricarboxylate transporter substrate binding protein [Alloalcanivorax mobilis]ASK33857.1 ABC transporter substrate-binding protein [Alcanivorax sp. N3-2A]